VRYGPIRPEPKPRLCEPKEESLKPSFESGCVTTSSDGDEFNMIGNHALS
jgi:hypothetical protein